MAPLNGTDTPLQWYEPDTAPLRLSGFALYAEERRYRRLRSVPLPEGVDNLANCTAGGQVAFASDSPQVAVRVALTGPAGMVHMPATGQCGVDLYIDGRFANTAKYDIRETTYELLLFGHHERQMREFTLNFPLYQGVERLQVGLLPDADVEAPRPWARAGRIVAYGTSILQGGCASRPGMAYTNILSRALNVEVVNLGFSGNGRGEPEVLAEVAAVPEPLLFILDYEANAGDTLPDTLPGAIEILQTRCPDVPVLLVSRIPFACDLTDTARRTQRDAFRAMQAELAAATGCHFVDGLTLLGDDFDECTVDGVHPNDLGFYRMAKALAPTIRSILGM